MIRERGDRLHTMLNRILTVVYIPYAVICFLLLMASETALTQTDPLMIAGGCIVAYAGLLTALTAHLCLFIASKLYRRGKKTVSYIVRFIPIMTMIIAFTVSLILELLAGI